MNRTRLLCCVLAFSLGLNAVLVGMGITARKPATKTPAKPGQRAWVFSNLFPLDHPEFKLTEAQKVQIAAIRREIDTEELTLNSQTVERMGRWATVLTGDELTSKAVEPCLAEMSVGMNDYMMRLVHSINKHRAVLTPEQNKLLTAKLQLRTADMKKSSQTIFNNTLQRVNTQYGEAFAREVLGPQTSGTLTLK